MPLPPNAAERELTHTREIRYVGYKRADGLWDLEAHLTDVKSHDQHMKAGVRRAGQPVHEMWLRVTIDKHMNVLDAAASSDAVPYPDGCEHIAPAYRKIIGLNLMKDFRKQLRAHFGGVKGCTHITELLGGLPTAAIQTFAGEMKEERPDGKRPFQLDQCHALDTRSETVRRWYPKWHKKEKASA